MSSDAAPANPPLSVDGSAVRGIAMQIIAVAGFSVMGMMIKLLEGRYPTSEVILFRCWPALIPLLLYLPMQGGFSALKTRRPFWHLVRTGSGPQGNPRLETSRPEGRPDDKIPVDDPWYRVRRRGLGSHAARL